MKNRLIAVLLAAGAAFGARGDTWTDPDTGIEWTYFVSNGKASLGSGFSSETAVDKSTTGEIVIPSSLGGSPVTSILAYAFSGCTNLTSVTIPDSVTSIGDYAFYDCSGLTSVTIPDSVTSVGQAAFSGCSGLTSVTIPDGVTSIGKAAFSGCSGLTSVTVPDSVTSIGEEAFSFCTNLTSVTIPQCVLDRQIRTVFFLTCGYDPFTRRPQYDTAYNSAITNISYSSTITNIGYQAFSGCCGLTSVTIPDSVTSIGEGAFSDCSGLTSMTIPDSVTNIGDHAFTGCTNLMSVTIPQYVLDRQISKVFSMGNYVGSHYYHDYYYSAFTNISYSSTITCIGEEAFSFCTNLTSVTIPNSVTSIGGGAFYNCSGLTAVHVTDLAAWCRISFADNPLKYAHNLYLHGEKVEDLIIPDGVTSISSFAFSGCSGLTSVTIPNSVTSIGSYAFLNCSGLTSVTIPNSVTSIGPYAFLNCNGLASVTIPGSVTSIGQWAFHDCTGLTSVTISNGVTSIGDEAFYGCSGLSSVTIPDSVTSFGANCFEGCPVYMRKLYQTILGVDGGGSSSASTTIVQQVEAPYTLTDHVTDRAVASVTVNADCAIDEFVLKDGKVYDSVLYVNNTADRAVTLSLPEGYEYMVFKNAKPLLIPANSRHIITITRVADRTFLISREELELLK